MMLDSRRWQNPLKKDRFILSPFFLADSILELETLAQPNWVINDPEVTGDTTEDRMNEIHRSLASLVQDIVGRQERPVAVVGDCCHTIGMLAGMQKSGIRPAVIWFDAHGDFNTLETSPSGFLGGMPLAMLVGRGDQTLMRAVGLEPIPEGTVWLAGARDLDPGESEALEKSSVHRLEDVSQLVDLRPPDGPLYVHFDTDVVSDREVPAQNYLAKGGPSSEAVEGVFARLAETRQVVAVSMSTWNPALPGAERSQKVCLRLLSRLTEGL